MPRVPLGSSLPNVAPPSNTPVFSGVRASPDAFGAEIGRALQQSGRQTVAMGEELAKTIIKEEITQRKLDIDMSSNDMSAEIRSIWSGDGTAANPGLTSMEGQRGVDGARSAMEQVLAKQAELEDGPQYKNKPIALAALQARLAAQLNTANGNFARHGAAQRKVQVQREAKTTVANNADAAARSYADIQAVFSQIDLGWGAGIDEGRSIDLEGDELERFALTRASQVAEAAIQGAINAGDPEAAIALITAEGMQQLITGEQESALTAKIATSAVARLGQDAAERAAALFPGEYTKQNNWLRENYSGEVEDKAHIMLKGLDVDLRQLRTDFRTEETFRMAGIRFSQQRNDRITRKGQESFEQGAVRGIQSGQTRYELLDPVMRSRLTTADRTALQEIQRKVDGNVPIVTDDVWVEDMWDMTPKEAWDTSIIVLHSKVNDRDFPWVRARLMAIRDNKGESDIHFTKEQTFKTFADNAKLTGTSKLKARNHLRMLYQETVEIKERENKQKKLTSTEYGDIMKELIEKNTFIDAHPVGGFFGRDFNATTFRLFREIPKEWITEQNARAKAAGLAEPTPAALVQLYAIQLEPD